MQHRRVKYEVDEIMSYCTNFCYWAMHLMQMNDTNKEGDIDRLVLSCKMNIPFFYLHSTLSKYFVENVDFIMKTVISSSPRTKVRLFEGSFVNKRGGIGNNAESDLVMKWNIRQIKDDIKHLGGNKTKKAIIGATMASAMLATVDKNFHAMVKGRHKSTKHCNTVSETDRDQVKNLNKRNMCLNHHFITLIWPKWKKT